MLVVRPIVIRWQVLRSALPARDSFKIDSYSPVVLFVKHGLARHHRSRAVHGTELPFPKRQHRDHFPLTGFLGQCALLRMLLYETHLLCGHAGVLLDCEFLSIQIYLR